METSVATQPLDQLMQLEPKIIERYVPANAAEQKAAFLEGSVDNPDHNYDRLVATNFDENIAEINAIGQVVLQTLEPDSKYTQPHEDFINKYDAQTRLMQLAHDFKHAVDPEERADAQRCYMALNIELYGAPDENTYRSLLNEKIQAILAKDLQGDATVLRDELLAITGYNPDEPAVERFKPSQDTIDWMHDVVETLYGGMLSHVPDQEQFTPDETAEVFRTILREEFGEAAAGWTVQVTKAQSVNVQAREKCIIIPENRPAISREKLQGLTVHEIGVHTLRAIQGYETDLPILATGLASYYDAEEGLGTVMEQALRGRYREAGVAAYISAGAAYFEGKDFREVFELKWRLEVLGNLKSNENMSEEMIAKARNTAYDSIMRSMRGTDALPWFKDLAYYNGAASMWRYLEDIRGDDLKFMFLLMGKADPSNIKHERLLYETRTPHREAAS